MVATCAFPQLKYILASRKWYHISFFTFGTGWEYRIRHNAASSILKMQYDYYYKYLL